MAIEKKIKIKVDSSYAVKNLDELNKILEEQDLIVQKLQIQHKKLQDQLSETPRDDIETQKKLNKELSSVSASLEKQRKIGVNLKKQQKDLSEETKNLTNDLVSNGGAMGLLNELTGGLAQKFKDSYEAISLSSKGLSGFKRAMLATGIGALVLGVGLLVANFDKVKDFLSGISAESKAAREALEKEAEALNQSIAKQTTELQTVARAYESGALKGENLKNVVNDLNEKYEDANLELDENNELTSDSLAFIDNQVKAIKVQAKNKAILTNIEALYSDELQAQTLIGQENNKFMVERAKLEELLAKKLAATTVAEKRSLDREINASNIKQKRIAKDIASLTRQRAKIQSAIDAETRRLDFTEFAKPKKRAKGSKSSGKSAEDIAKEEDRKEADRLKKLEDLKNKIRDESANKEDEARKLELKKIREHNKALMVEALVNGLLSQELIDSLNQKEVAKQAEFDAIDKERKNKKKAAAKAKKEKEDADERERLKIQKEFEEEQYRTGFDNLQNILSVGGKKMEKVGKALAIADVVRTAQKSISSTISSTAEANAKAVAASPLTSGMPFVGINTAKAALSIGSTVASAAKSINSIKGDSKSVSGGGGAAAGGGGGGSQPPAFNIVGASDTNQLADAIGAQEQQPVQAYVVANDVTTAQSLQNNIVEGATIG